MDNLAETKTPDQAQQAVFKRAPAVKARVADLNQGEWKDKFLELKTGEQVSRCRVLGTIVTKFLSDEGTFANITLDDSTDTIRAKTWDDMKLIEKTSIGDIVDLIGKVRIYNGEIYIVPEIIKKVDDPNFEMLRKLELIKKYGSYKKEKTENKMEEIKTDKVDLRKEIIKMIEESKEGISYIEILEKTKAPQAEAENVINDLLGGGLCYESSPGVIKKI